MQIGFVSFRKYAEIRRKSDHGVADGFEFLVLFERNLLRHLVGIGAELFASALVPHVIERGELFVFRKSFYDFVDEFFIICAKVSVNFFTLNGRKPLGKLKKIFLQRGRIERRLTDLFRNIGKIFPEFSFDIITEL